MGVGIGLLVSWGTKKITEAAQRVQNVATQSKEAADAAQSTTSSLKDLVSAYEELGDKSGWGTEDFDQAKDIQAEILDLAKEQGTLDEDKLGKLDLQNGKYEEQLGLLQDITAEQLEASRYELTQNKDAQGDKLVDTAKKNNRTHYLTVWSAPEMDMGDQIKNAGIDIFNKFGGYGPDDLKDADSIVDYYNEVGKALKYVIDNTTEAERAAGGTYHSLYQFLLDEQTALRDDVDSYNDSTDAINNNTNARRKLQAVDFWQNGNNNSMDVSFTFDKVNSAVQTLEDTIDGFDASKLNDLLWGTNEGLSDEQAQALANLRKALTDMDFSADTNGVNAFIQALVQVGIVAQSSANGVDAVAQASQKMEDISSEIDEIQTAYKNATTAIDEYNKYGYLSADTLQTLLNEDFEYLSCLELVDGQLQVNTEKYQGMIAAQYQSAAMALVEKANAELAKIAQGEKKDAVEDATKATEDQATALTERVCPALGEFAKASMTAAAAQEFLANGDAAWSVDPERTKEVYAGLASGLNILDATVDQIMGNSDKFRQHMNGFDKETKNRNKNTAKSVTDVASAFDTLNKAMKEYNQYGYMSASNIKALIGLEDAYTSCLIENGNELEINAKQFRAIMVAQLAHEKEINGTTKKTEELTRIISWMDENVKEATISYAQLTDIIKGYGAAMDEAREKTDGLKNAFNGWADVRDKVRADNGAFNEILDYDKTVALESSLRELVKYPGLIKEAFNAETGRVDLGGDVLKTAVIDSLEKQAKIARETGGEAAEAIAAAYEKSAEDIKGDIISVEQYFRGLDAALNDINNRLDAFQTSFNDIGDIVNEYNTYGALSQDNYQKLLAISPEYLKCLELEGNYLVFNKEAYKELYIAQIDSKIAEYEQKESTKEYAEILRQLKEALGNVTDHMKGMGTEAQRLSSLLSNLKSVFSSVMDSINNANSAQSNKLQIWGNAAIKELDNRIDALNDQKDALEDQKEALQKANDEEERAITLAKLKAALEKAQTQRTIRKYTSNGYEWVIDEAALKEAQDNLSDQEREWAKEDAEAAIDAQIEAIDKQIDSINDLKEQWQDAMNMIGESWDDYQERLKAEAAFQGMTLEQMASSVAGYKDSVVANMQAINAASDMSTAIDNISKFIDTLAKLGNIVSLLTGGDGNGGILALFNFAKNILGGGGGGFWNSVKSFFSGGSAPITNTAGDVTAVTGEAVASSGIGKLWNTVKEYAKTGIQDISGVMGKGVNWLINIGKTGWNGISSTVSNGWNAITSLTGYGTNALTATMSTGFNAILTGAQSLVSSLTSLFTGAGASAGLAGLGAVGVAGAVVGAGVTNTAATFSHQNEIWSNKNDSFWKKLVKSVGQFIFDASPLGLVYNVGSAIFGKKKTADAPKRASGDKHIKNKGLYNVDEKGPELIIRQPESGRLTNLEAGDAVVPSDMTDNLFEMGADPDQWAQDHLQVQANEGGEGLSLGASDNGGRTPTEILSYWMEIFTAWLVTLLNMITSAMDTVKKQWTALFYGDGALISIAKDAENVILYDTSTFFNGEGGLISAFNQAYETIIGGAIEMVATLKSIISEAVAMANQRAASGGGGGVVSGAIGKTVTTVGGAAAGAVVGGALLGPIGAIAGGLLGGFLGSKLAVGTKSAPKSQFHNVDERGPELIVRKPVAGRYTYLEAGDGVVPADITSRLFEMGGNPDKWLKEQIAHLNSTTPAIVAHENAPNINIGDININKPVGDVDELARAISTQLPNKLLQMQSKR